MEFNLTFAGVQAEREMEKNAKHREREREREKSCKGWLETKKHILYELKCITVFKNTRTNNLESYKHQVSTCIQ